ncbi:MAG: DUF368 domain-containing protein [Treponema sp.]|nr:DUF368 domain-containing protein [Treponema sp.]
MEVIKLTAIGFVLGITAVIPGFSVATMALIFNVYDRLINVIVPNVKKILASWLFLLPLIIGGIAGIIFFSIVFSRLMENYSAVAYWFFIGVIIGSIPVIYFKVTGTPSAQNKINLPSIPAIICFVLAVTAMIFMAINKPQASEVYTEFTLPIILLLFLAGALGAMAMIIPGISGAFVLLVMGLYPTIIGFIPARNFLMLLPVILGACAGILLGAAFVRFLLKKVPQQTYSAVLGLVIGSIFVLYQYSGGFNGNTGFEIIISIVCLLAGFTLSFLMSRKKEAVKENV